LKPDDKVQAVARLASIIILMASTAGVLAGCNSSGSLYSQGPWGRSSTPRNYPQYPAPWDQRVPGSQHRVTEEAGVDPAAFARASVGKPPIIPSAFRNEARLPEDPQPVALVAPVPEETAQGTPDQAVASREVQAAAPSQAPATVESPPGIFSSPRLASSYAGTWRASDDKGNSCLVHLSSVSSLDLYKATTSKCASESLRSVNAWSFEQNRIVLLSHGVEIAHLAGAEASLSGALTKSGTPLTMAR
jgi:hypothetical protein